MVETLVGFLVAVFLVAAIGHGLWVLGRAVIVGIARMFGSAREPLVAARMCPRCGEAWPASSGLWSCPLCSEAAKPGVLAGDAVPARITSLLLRRIERLNGAGLLSAAARARLMQALATEERPPAFLPVPRDSRERPAWAEIAGRPAEPDIAFVGEGAEPAPAEPEPAAPNDVRRDVAARARTFLNARRSEAETPVESAPGDRHEPKEAEPALPLTKLLSAFLEESNIRWGELVGGLLIVGCSLALVVSFWSSIAARPVLKFGLFHGVTALLFGFGFHALRRWKLPSTAMGLLLIATLLTPLNFLGAALLARGGSPTPSWGLLAEIAAGALFAALTYGAGRSLVPNRAGALPVGVLAPALGMLVVPRALGPGSSLAVLMSLAAWPLLAQVGAVGGWLNRAQRGPLEGRRPVFELGRLLGASTFAVALALGLIVKESGSIPAALHDLAPLAPLAAAPALAAGLWLWRRVGTDDGSTDRVAGAAIATAALLVLLGGLPLAWPEPSGLIPAAIASAAVLALVARLAGIPAAAAPAAACLGFAAWLAGLVAGGHLGWAATPSEAARALASASSGTALLPIAFGMASAAGAFLRTGRRAEARMVAFVAGLASLVSLALVGWHGAAQPGDPAGMAWVYTVHALGLLIAAPWFGRHRLLEGPRDAALTRALATAASILGLLALVQGLGWGGWGSGLAWPLAAACLAHAALATLISGAIGLGRGRTPSSAWAGSLAQVDRVLAATALATSVAGAGLLAVRVPQADPGLIAQHLAALAALWLALACRFASPGLFAAFQAALAGTIAFGVSAVVAPRPWYRSAPVPWLDPRTLQALGLALGAYVLAWTGLRAVLRRKPRSGAVASGPWPVVRSFLDPPWPAFDRVLRGGLVLVLVALAVYGAMPGVARELTPRQLARHLVAAPAPRVGRVVPPASAFEVLGIAHAPALGAGSWWLLGLLLVATTADLAVRFRRLGVLSLILVATAAVPLAAGRWESQMAAASALRWAGALGLFVASALIWARRPIVRLAAGLGLELPPEPRDRQGLVELASGLVLGLSLAPLLLMGAYVGVAALLGRPPDDRMADTLAGASLLFVFLVTGGMLLTWLVGRSDRGAWGRPTGALLMVLGTLPLVAVSVFAVGTALAGNPIVGPNRGTFFHRIGLAGSFVPPILVLAATLTGHAIRERRSAFAFSAGLVLNLAATVGFLLAGTSRGLALDAVLAVSLALLNSAVSAAWSLAWIGALAREQGRTGKPADASNPLLSATIQLAVTLVVLVLAGATVNLLLAPRDLVADAALAGVLGWAAFGLTMAAVWARSRLGRQPLSGGWLGLGAITGAAFLAFGMAPRDTGDWLVYHGLLAGELVAATLLLGSALQAAGPGTRADRLRISQFVSLALGLAVTFAIVGYWDDPQSPYWTVGGLAFAGGLAAVQALVREQPARLYRATVLFNLAATFAWCATAWWAQAWRTGSPFVDILNLNILVLALPAPLWQLLHRRILTGEPLRPAEWPGSRLAPFAPHRVVANLALSAFLLVVATGLARDAALAGARPEIALGGVAAVAIALALLADRRAASFGLYALGLAAAGWAVHALHLPPRWLVWTGTVVLAAYTLATCYLATRGALLNTLTGRRTGAEDLADEAPGGLAKPPERPAASLPAWLLPATLGLGLVVGLLAFGSILNDLEPVLRNTAAQAVFAVVLAIGLLAQGERRQRLQALALGVGVVGAIALGWAWIAPDSPTARIDRIAAALSAVALVAILYGLGLAKFGPRWSEWTSAARQLVPALLGLAGLLLATVLGVEGAEHAPGGTPTISATAIGLVAAVLIGAAIAAMVAAVVPGRDPLRLTERRRTAYVYAAELMLALLLVHLKLTVPWIFSPFFARFWPLILLGVSFLGVGLSELFRRQGRHVLADPLERTGALLPLLPVAAALWTAPQPGQDVAFFLLAGSLYTTLALLRTSLGFGAVAALAFNAALWTLLGRAGGLGLAEHPQLWIIPPAFCVLVGGYLGRDRLNASQAAAVRYAAALAIYVASTADMVLTGVAVAPWLPLVLGALSIAGLLAGIQFRIRGFLYLGTAFLALSVFSMIWYAAVDLDQTWIWWASGIVAGILILVLFGLFEKKRQDVLEVVDQLRAWNP